MRGRNAGSWVAVGLTIAFIVASIALLLGSVKAGKDDSYIKDYNDGACMVVKQEYPDKMPEYCRGN